MEGDGQVRGGGEKLEGAAPADVAAQDASGDLVAVGDGHHVAVADVQPGQEEDRQETGAASGVSSGRLTQTCSHVGRRLRGRRDDLKG